jgi:hypothetical protein
MRRRRIYATDAIKILVDVMRVKGCEKPNPHIFFFY